jgi:PAS domain S-box-containing protein
MLESLVVAYVGDEESGLDLVARLDQQLQRPVRLVTARPDRLPSVLESDRIDCLVCGSSLSDGDLQRVVFDVVDHREELPIFDTSGDVAAVPSRIEIHQLDLDTSTRELADAILAEVLDSAEKTETDLLHGPFSYLAVDTEWRIVDWDPQLSAWFDWEPDEAIGTPLWEVFPGWEDSEFEEACREAMEWDEETSTRVFHGPSRKWLDFEIIGTRGDGLDLFGLDVTEFQNAGGNIEGTSARFEETLDRITDAFFALDNEERFVFLNSQAEFLLDLDANDVTGVRFWDAFPAAVSTTFYQEFNRALETQEPVSFEEYYKPLDSWFEVNAYPSSEGLSVFLRDITEQVELQDKLEQLHEVTRGLVVAESDREIAERTVTATEDVLDFPMVSLWKRDDTTELLEPLAWSDEIDERVDEMESLGPDSEFIWEVYETGEPRMLGFVPATTTTSHHPGKVTSELLVRIGEYGVLGAYSDERDEFDETDIELFKILSSTVESALRRAERERQLARRNERLNDFASIVSHDLRNPLNVASSHTELARLTDDPEEHLDQIEDSLLRMEELIEDLLTRARGEGEIEREQLSLAQTAREAWGSVDTKSATLKLDGDGRLKADPDRLQQLFENLFRNAVEHGGHSVTIRIGTTDDGFYIADNGPGIPEDKRDGIFEQGVTHSEDGTGYGLAIVADIVDGHGWDISVGESSDGGARFDISNLYSLSSMPEAA